MRAAAAAALALAGLVAGCASPVVSQVECRAAEAPPGVALSYASALNSSLAAHLPGTNSLLVAPSAQSLLAVPVAELGRSPTGNPSLRLDIVNCGARPLWVRARTQFMGAQGQLTEPRSAWREFQILPRSVHSYEELGFQPASVTFRTEIDLIEPPR